jgi:hypothetical protein
VPPSRALALQEAAPAAGERQQHDRAGEIATDPTLHTRKNAGSFFNEASMLTVWEFVKDKESLPTHDPEKHVLDLIGDGNRFPAVAKPASAGEGRSDKIMRPGSA